MSYLSFLLVLAATTWLFSANYINPPATADEIVVALVLLLAALVMMFVRELQARIR
jgi:hypothetical protein